MKSWIFEKLMDNYMVITCSIFFYIYNAWNFHGEATNFHGEATNFCGEATNFHGEATNLFHHHLKLQFEWCHWARKYRFPCKKTAFSCEENAVFAVVNRYS